MTKPQLPNLQKLSPTRSTASTSATVTTSTSLSWYLRKPGSHQSIFNVEQKFRDCGRSLKENIEFANQIRSSEWFFLEEKTFWINQENFKKSKAQNMQ